MNSSAMAAKPMVATGGDCPATGGTNEENLSSSMLYVHGVESRAGSGENERPVEVRQTFRAAEHSRRRQAGHAYAIEQINCTAMKGDIGGNKMKSGMGTEFLDVRGDHVTGHGEFIESMENGDKNLYKYEFSGTTKDGAFESGTNKWSLIEGGGKMKGGKANGTCKAKANPDHSTAFDCMGTYTPPAT